MPRRHRLPPAWPLALVLSCQLVLPISGMDHDADVTNEGTIETPKLVANYSYLFEMPSNPADRGRNFSKNARALRKYLLEDSDYYSVLPPPGDGVVRETNFGTPTEAATRSWACATANCRSRACSSTPNPSSPNTATRC